MARTVLCLAAGVYVKREPLKRWYNVWIVPNYIDLSSRVIALFVTVQIIVLYQANYLTLGGLGTPPPYGAILNYLEQAFQLNIIGLVPAGRLNLNPPGISEEEAMDARDNNPSLKKASIVSFALKYRPKFWWFDLLVLLRRVVLTSVVLIFDSEQDMDSFALFFCFWYGTPGEGMRAVRGVQDLVGDIFPAVASGDLHRSSGSCKQ